MTFDSLGLSAEIQRAVSEKGYHTPTPIQAQAIPSILEGRDLMGGAQTGTGKTAGFTLPILQRLLSDNLPASRNKGQRTIRALVLTPTRELASQVHDNVREYGKYTPLRSAVVFGGVKIIPQIHKLKRGVDILVATPGRLLDHISQKTIDLSRLEILVLDEADRMLDMGFIRDIKKVLAILPKKKQTLLFSATFSNDIKKLANGLLHAPACIEVAPQNTTTDTVAQTVYSVDRARKRELLSWLVGANNWQQVLVFTRTKHIANRLSEQLQKDGITAAAIHGNKSQGARNRALSEFKDGKVRVLVATDIAARGIDIARLPHVINYELPNSAEDYVHRIGRTGRAGNEGEAISLVCVDEHKLLNEIEKLIKRKLPKQIIEGYEPDPSIKPEPVQKSRNNKSAKNKPGKNKPPRHKRQGKPKPSQGANANKKPARRRKRSNQAA